MSVAYNGLSDAQITEVKGYGMIEDPKLKLTFRGSPSPAAAVELLKMHPIEKNYIPGGVPINGYLAYISCVRAMKLFSFISQAYAKDDFTIRFDPKSFHPDKMANLKHQGAIRIPSVLGDGIYDIDFSRMLGGSQNTSSVRYTPSVITIPVTGRAGIFNRHLTLDSSIGEEKGRIFPYFKHMVEPDKVFTATVFSRLFFKCLGSDWSSAARAWQRIREGLRSLALTEAGQAISHAFMGIQLAENSQSGIRFIIDNGIYYGFVLFGDFLVLINGVRYSEVDNAAMMLEFAKLNQKDRLRTEIIQILGTPTKQDGTPFYSFTMDSLASSRKILICLHAIDEDFFTPDQFKEISSKIDQLRLGDSYAEVNAKNLAIAFTYIQTGEGNSLLGFNAYLMNGYYRARDRTSVALGIFGPLAPNFNFGNPKEREIVFPSAMANDPNMSMVDGKRPLPFLPYKLQPVRFAVSRMDAAFSNGSLRIPFGRKKGKQEEFSDPTKRDGIFSGNELTELYLKMKACANLKREMGGSRKRKLVSNDETAAKRKKNKETRDADDAGLF